MGTSWSTQGRIRGGRADGGNRWVRLIVSILVFVAYTVLPFPGTGNPASADATGTAAEGGEPDAVSEGDADSEEEYATTPFDNPFFLPVLLTGFALWLLYDGFLNQEFIQRNLEEGDTFAIAFNQWGGPLLALLAIWFTIKAIRERRAASRSKESS